MSPAKPYLAHHVSVLITEISPEDGMFEGSQEHYFSVGQSALECIKLAAFEGGQHRFSNILDFGSGFGRVLRALKSGFPAAQLTACDINANAISFCSRIFGATAIQSSEDISDLCIDDRFDLIWCGTVLTNVDAMQFLDILRFLKTLLKKNGILVFTTHGPYVAQRIRSGAFTYGLQQDLIPALLEDYDRAGFGYADYPAEVRARVRLKRYGISVSTPHWTLRQLKSFSELRILNYTEQFWDNHQDSVACVNSGV